MISDEESSLKISLCFVMKFSALSPGLKNKERSADGYKLW